MNVIRIKLDESGATIPCSSSLIFGIKLIALALRFVRLLL